MLDREPDCKEACSNFFNSCKTWTVSNMPEIMSISNMATTVITVETQTSECSNGVFNQFYTSGGNTPPQQHVKKDNLALSITGSSQDVVAWTVMPVVQTRRMLCVSK